MRRRLFNLAAVVSLVLFMTTAALWVRSYFVMDTWSWRRPSNEAASLSLMSGRGGVAGWHRRDSVLLNGSGPHMTWTRGAARGYLEGFDGKFRSVGRKWRFLGFGVLSDAQASSFFFVTTGTAVFVPYWAIVAATALFPMLWLRAHTRDSRIAAHRARQRCTSCGYDLRATPGRCPECGAAPEPATQTAV